jgi:hypothetical protein
MQAFWKRHRDPEAEPRSRRSHPAGTNLEKRRKLTSGEGGIAASAFDDQDWEQVDKLLANQEASAPVPVFQFSGSPLASSLAALRASLNTQILPAGPMTDRLLDVWALVHQVDPAAARPVESVLSSLVGRDLMSAREISQMCDQVEAALKPPGPSEPNRSEPGPGEPNPGRAEKARPVAVRSPCDAAGTTASRQKGTR